MPDEDRDFQRRLPSVERKISDIKPEDIRVSVTGTVIDKQDDRVVVIDDGTGTISATFEAPDALKDVSPNQMVRILGRIISMDNGFELQGDAIQDMVGLDLELKKRVDSLGT